MSYSPSQNLSSTATGRSVLNAADATAARSVIGASATTHTHAASDTTSGTFSISLLPAGSILYSESELARPTARTDIRVLFLTAADPSAVMITGDEWHRRA